MSDHSDTVYNAPAYLKSNVWKRLGFYKKEGHLDKSLAICKVCRTAIKYSSSTTNLKTHLVRRHGENYAGDEEPVDANVSKYTASTSQNTQDNDMAIKDFFQPQLGEVQDNHGIYSLFYCEGLTTSQCGWEWWLSRHGKVSNGTRKFLILIYNWKLIIKNTWGAVSDCIIS